MPLTLKLPRRTHSLAETQRLFASLILRRLTPRGGMQKTLATCRPTAELTDAIVKPNDRLTSFERVQIYNRQYWFRLYECLSNDFPALASCLGPRRFHTLATSYLETCPSRSFTLRNLGRFLHTFLLKHPELTTPYTQLALDVAALEWALVEAFDGAAIAPLTQEKLAGTNPQTLRLQLQPHITLLTSRYPIDDYQLAVKAAAHAGKRRPPRPHLLSANAAPIHLAVHRHDNSVYHKHLPPAAYQLLKRLTRGRTLAGSFEGLRPMPDPEEVRHWFETWMRLGWLIPVHPSLSRNRRTRREVPA